jgi:deazaflavin-dependent oxidoreductase (nitroreductase family)
MRGRRLELAHGSEQVNGKAKVSMDQDFNQQVINEFRANGGKVGGPFEGAPMVLLNAIGRKSGKVQTVPLVAFHEGGNVYIIASKGGSPSHPTWYHNLKANPDVTIEIGTDTREVTAHELDTAERDVIWPQIVALMPQFGEYEKHTQGRIIPLFRMDPR